MNVILYLRISSSKQSLVNQKELCVNYILKRKYNCLLIIEEQYSAYGTIPRKLNMLLNDIKEHKYDMVNKIIIYNYDRLSRNIRSVFEILDILKEKNIKIESVVDNIDDYTSPYGEEQLLRRFLMGQTESKLISMRVKDSILSRKMSGTFVSGHTPFGFMRDPDDNIKLVKNEDEHLVIGFIRHLKRGNIKGNEIFGWLTKLTDINSVANVNFDKDTMNLCDGDDTQHEKKSNNLAEIEIKHEHVYDGITYAEIMLFLNKYGINNRGKKWTKHGVIHICNRNDDSYEADCCIKIEEPLERTNVKSLKRKNSQLFEPLQKKLRFCKNEMKIYTQIKGIVDKNDKLQHK